MASPSALLPQLRRVLQGCGLWGRGIGISATLGGPWERRATKDWGQTRYAPRRIWGGRRHGPKHRLPWKRESDSL